MERSDGALRVYRDRQTKPLLIAMGLIFLVSGLIGLLGFVLTGGLA